MTVSERSLIPDIDPSLEHTTIGALANAAGDYDFVVSAYVLSAGSRFASFLLPCRQSYLDVSAVVSFLMGQQIHPGDLAYAGEYVSYGECGFMLMTTGVRRLDSWRARRRRSWHVT